MSYSIRLTSSALRDYLRCYAIARNGISTDILSFFSDCRNVFIAVIELELSKMPGIKVWICAIAEFVRTTDAERETVISYFGKQFPILHGSQVSATLDQAAEFLRLKIEGFEERGSSWTLLTIKQLDLHFYVYSPLRAAMFVPLPREIISKRAVVNVRNYDEECFRWSILAALHPVEQHKNRVSSYEPFRNELNFDGIDFPVRLADIEKFSALNTDISVNVYGCEGGLVRALRLCQRKRPNHVNLMHHGGHYSLITGLDRLLGDQNKHKKRGYYCDKCLFPQYSEERLREHEYFCMEESLSRLELPDPTTNTLSFKNYRRRIRAPVTVYADFESILRPIATCTPRPGQSHTEKLQEHIPCSFGAIAVNSCCGHDLSYGAYECSTGEDCVERFVGYLVRLASQTVSTINRYPAVSSMHMTDAEKQDYRQAADCWICEKALGNDGVRDHCHVCARYRGAAHSECNIQLQLSKSVIVFMHNLRRYDGHILVKAFGTICGLLKLELSCIPKGTEDYISFTIREPFQRKRTSAGGGLKERCTIVFVDSCQFLPSSLDALAKTLPRNAFPALDLAFPSQKADLLKRKGVFPYDFLDDWHKLASQTQPPTRQDFYNKLTKTDISEEDYQHMLRVWGEFNIRNLCEYMELYLETDVRILCCVFEAFRRFSLDNFGLDPCHYYTLPSLAWDACLKVTKVELELLTDPLMYSFFEQGIRGGISTICKRYAKANNKELGAEFNPNKDTSYIAYLDANNLYGWAMMQPLPLGDFKWMTDEELDNFDLLGVSECDQIGYVLQVDLEYPNELHDEHNCLPLAVERVTVQDNELSAYCQELLSGGRHVATGKLVPNLNPKKDYIVHVRNLKFYVEMGLKVTKYTRGIKFRQSPWMVEYISSNTKRRKDAKSTHEKNLYKLLNNAVFGKTMENVRKYLRLVMVTSREKFMKLTKQPEFQSATAFSADLVACRMRPKTVSLNKPIAVGFTVLDVSKLFMYAVHYKEIRSRYGNRAVLLMTDTDSLMYHIQTADIYRDFETFLELFDTSDYPPGHFLQSDLNKKLVGKMKDETNGVPISEFVGLRSKMYSFCCGGDEHKRAKGVKRQVVKNTLHHKDYVDILRGKTHRYDDMCMIRSFLHNLYTVNLRKKSLAAFDDKRYILPDGESTLAYGHYRIREIEEKRAAADAATISGCG